MFLVLPQLGIAIVDDVLPTFYVADDHTWAKVTVSPVVVIVAMCVEHHYGPICTGINERIVYLGHGRWSTERVT